jgi:hypothetical protein
MPIERRETMRATMDPDMYGGKECDEMTPRWRCYAHGDKDSDHQQEPLTLDANMFPPGTIISVEEPVCPKCNETREPIYKDGKYLPGFAPKCRCGFDWDEWTANEYS